MKMDIYNLKNEKVGTVELPQGVFGAAWNPELVKQVLVATQANRRRPWAHVKDRSEVRGGGRKPWRQKGTGRARHGSRRSPIWIGGGKAHGPTAEKDYSQKINKKMKRAALASVLSRKVADSEMRVFDRLAFEEPKTKLASRALKHVLGLKPQAKKLDVLLVPNPEHREVTRAARNLVKVKVADPRSLNIEDILSYRNIFIDKEALPIIEQHYTLK